MEGSAEQLYDMHHYLLFRSPTLEADNLVVPSSTTFPTSDIVKHCLQTFPRVLSAWLRPSGLNLTEAFYIQQLLLLPFFLGVGRIEVLAAPQPLVFYSILKDLLILRPRT